MYAFAKQTFKAAGCQQAFTADLYIRILRARMRPLIYTTTTVVYTLAEFLPKVS